jgi:hypothetical protein
MKTIRLIDAAALLVMVLAGCADPTDVREPQAARPDTPTPPHTPTPPPPRAAFLEATTATALYGGVGASLAPLQVVARSAEGSSLASVGVNFSVIQGGGSTGRSERLTDGLGRASAGHWTLGPEPGDNTLIVWAEGARPVAFMAVADASGVAAVYGRVGAATTGLSADTVGKRLILFDDGTFTATAVVHDRDVDCVPDWSRCIRHVTRSGAFTRAAHAVMLSFDSSATPLHGTLRGDTLHLPDSADGVDAYRAAPVPTLPVKYERAEGHAYPDGAHSRYLFYPAERTFALQYENTKWGPFEYTGRYTLAGDSITLDFDGWSVAGPWQATAYIRSDSLVVRYNIIMALSDFEDGVYLRAHHGASIARGRGQEIQVAWPSSYRRGAVTDHRITPSLRASGVTK